MAATKTSASIDLDHVEDSEPERKRIKLQVAETKKRRTRQRQLQTTIVAHGSSPFSYIPTSPGPLCSEGLDGVSAKVTTGHTESVVIDIIGQYTVVFLDFTGELDTYVRWYKGELFQTILRILVPSST